MNYPIPNLKGMGKMPIPSLPRVKKTPQPLRKKNTIYPILEQQTITTILSPFGFNSIAEVEKINTLDEYYKYLDKTKQRNLMNNGGKNFRQVKQIVGLLKNQVRDLLFETEPKINTLRHIHSPYQERSNSPTLPLSSIEKLLAKHQKNLPSNLLNQNIFTTYVKPTSIQSTRSPAAYLKHIYDLANTIVNTDEELNLVNRRPDLNNLVLSEDNLNQELTTLELANELLLAHDLYPRDKVLYFKGICGLTSEQEIDQNNKNFTIEFWAKRTKTVDETLEDDYVLVG